MTMLKPVLGPVQLIFYGVGIIVGAGVYSVIGTAAGMAQSGLWLSFLMGAAVAALTGLSYAEMAAAFPNAGAEYKFLKEAFPRWGMISFVTGLLLLLGGAAAAATVAVAFGGYLRMFAGIPVWLSASLLLAACTALNIWGTRESSWANVAFTSVEVAGLVFVIAAGSTTGRMLEPLTAVGAGVLPAASAVFFVYLGFEKIANMTEEAERPTRDIPVAIFVSLGVTTVLYVLVSLAVVSLASPRDLAASDAPLALAIGHVWPGSERLLGAIALCSTANTVLISLVAGSRLIYSMGRDGEIPGRVAALLPGRDTPWVAAIILFALSELLVPIGSVQILAELSSLTALLAFLAVNGAVIMLRFRLPDHPRPFRVPLSIGRVPVIPGLAIVSIGVLIANFDWDIYLLTGAAGLASCLGYLLKRKPPR
jgi:basic amino acid/polyamine antiporter, APA family